MPLYADDPDVHATYPIKDANAGSLAWEAIVQTGTTDITAAWDGDVGPHPTDATATVRNLRVPLAGLAVGTHRLRLIVPGDNDVSLGNVTLV